MSALIWKESTQCFRVELNVISKLQMKDETWMQLRAESQKDQIQKDGKEIPLSLNGEL